MTLFDTVKCALCGPLPDPQVHDTCHKPWCGHKTRDHTAGMRCKGLQTGVRHQREQVIPVSLDPRDEPWEEQFTDDEWDAVVASANTGSSEDYSHLDGEDEDEAGGEVTHCDWVAE